MRTLKYIYLVLALLPLGQAAAQGEVFRWHDATGAVTFSDRKPPDRNADILPVSWQRPGATAATAADNAQGLGYARGAEPAQTGPQSASPTNTKAPPAVDDPKKADKAKEDRRAHALNDWLVTNCGFEPGVGHLSGRKTPDTYRCDAPLPRSLAVAFKQAKSGAAVEVGCRGEARCSH